MKIEQILILDYSICSALFFLHDHFYLFWIALSVLDCSYFRSSKDHLLLILCYYKRKLEICFNQNIVCFVEGTGGTTNSVWSYYQSK